MHLFLIGSNTLVWWISNLLLMSYNAPALQNQATIPTFCFCLVTHMEAFVMSIPQTIIQARHSLGLTQQQLADQTGISLSTIQKYERDAKDINSAKLLNLLKMTAALKCQLKDILTDEEVLKML